MVNPTSESADGDGWELKHQAAIEIEPEIGCHFPCRTAAYRELDDNLGLSADVLQIVPCCGGVQ
jgi:hypothetical protein